uniref:Uncharacterized protein n=1 Tax=Arundo donax TaxID=35708 RepID=A0A0A9GZ34_ARUDO
MWMTWRPWPTATRILRGQGGHHREGILRGRRGQHDRGKGSTTRYALEKAALGASRQPRQEWKRGVLEQPPSQVEEAAPDQRRG